MPKTFTIDLDCVQDYHILVSWSIMKNSGLNEEPSTSSLLDISLLELNLDKILSESHLPPVLC